jgi:hypothetical protein
MGSGYSKSYQRRVARYLIVLLLISGISSALYNQHTTHSTSTERAYADDGSRSKQQQEQQLRGESIIPDNDGTQTQQVVTDAPEEDSSAQPSSASEKKAIIGKITISFGEPDEVFDRAIRSHELHNKNMGYPQYVLRERVLPGLWSKHAYIFSVIVQELAKPEAERLQWVMYVFRSPGLDQTSTNKN